jgi:hypothetical protein
MVFWGFYFIAKAFLYLQGHIQFDLYLNLILAVYALMPLKIRYLGGVSGLKGNASRYVYGLLAVPLSLSILWHDSYLPPFRFLVNYLSNPVTRPSGKYMFEFVSNYWSLSLVAVFLVILCFSYLIRKYRFSWGVLVVLPLLVPPVHLLVMSRSEGKTLESLKPATWLTAGAPTSILKLPDPARGFDIVILHVCSLSWDDLKNVGMDQDSFLDQFDVLYQNFNTWSSYSTPSALRLLRATCPQSEHESLYRPVSDRCLLFDSLRKSGFQTDTLFNHQGKLSDKMEVEISALAKADPPMKYSGLHPVIINYDGAPIFDNFEVLDLWWRKRQQKPQQSRVVFFNSVSLHGGNHLSRDKNSWWTRTRSSEYKETLGMSFSEFRRFFDEIKRSGKDVLVFMVPEHGAALVGDSVQGPDLRDIPMPKLTLVPMGIKFIGSGWGRLPKFRVNQLSSYPVIPQVINAAIRKRVPRQGGNSEFDLKDFESSPTPEFFAESENASTTIRDGKVFFRRKNQEWRSLPSSFLPETFSDPEARGH